MIKTPLSTVIGGAFWTPSATTLGGTSKTFDQIIKSLFANNEQGFAYDPNDLTTMFKDAAGTVPVTAVGQPLGLVLDKSGCGNHARQTVSASRPILQQTPPLSNVNLVTNGDFSDGLSGYSVIGTNAKIAVLNNELVVTGNGNSYPGARKVINNLTVGKEYVISVKARQGTTTQAVNISVNISGVRMSMFGTESSVMSLKFTADATTKNVDLSISDAAATGTAYFDDLTLFEVKGYRTDQNYIEYDKVDDKLITNLPAQLTGCTVVRAVPNVGIQILTGQTIPATYEDNKDHCGLIVINRALTPSETSAITAEFNKRVGV